MLDCIWQDGYRYAKAGILIHDIAAPGCQQESLLDSPARERTGTLMATLDNINQQGIGKVWLAAQGMEAHQPEWGMKRQRLSPAYTTRWQDLISIG